MSQATLNGQVVEDQGLACTCHFEWGASTEYGFVTPEIGGLVTGDTFSSTIYGLGEGVVYHFRSVANNGVSIAYGNDMTFAIPVGSTIPVLMDDADLALVLEAKK